VSRIWTSGLFLLFMAGCHRYRAPASFVRMGDPATDAQLVSGFYDLEGDSGNRWRWTGPDFVIALAPPPDPRGARLRLRLYFPETQIENLGPITLTAFVDSKPLAPQTFGKAGTYDFVRDVPACALETNVLPLHFELDRYSPKTAAEGRDLGVVVLMAALEPK